MKAIALALLLAGTGDEAPNTYILQMWALPGGPYAARTIGPLSARNCQSALTKLKEHPDTLHDKFPAGTELIQMCASPDALRAWFAGKKCSVTSSTPVNGAPQVSAYRCHRQ
jgi:hypothetical protein